MHSDGNANLDPTDSHDSDLSARNAGSLPAGNPDFESIITGIWLDLLGIPAASRGTGPQISIHENFFEIGGTSLLATVLLKRINATFGRTLPIATVFEHSTIRSQATFLRGEVDVPAHSDSSTDLDLRQAGPDKNACSSNAIAIIGMTGRFPGAESVEAFWQNLKDGVESITFFDRSELEPSEQIIADQNENYVAARPLLKNPDMFDADFFGVYPKEAAQMDPQHRILLECAWEVLERAGYDPAHTRESVGVFAGCSMNTYFMRNLANEQEAGQRKFLEDFTGGYQVANYAAMMGNDKDFLPTRISYKLNLHGPSMSVQSACSTALVAVAQACQSLMTQGCDMALAGAVSVTFPLHRGYVAQEGGLASMDGHCRPFDEKASGTVFGHGAGIVLLKRLDDAISDGDQVLAVIQGFALNNDGSAKAGYTAPSVDGQAKVIARAQKMAGVTADQVSYIEAHGTGTPLGDPIEVAGLNKAFRLTTDQQHFCSLGTGKANVGHLDVAAGATGLIKTVLQIQNRTIPGLLHFQNSNPHLNLAGSPFFIDQQTRAWDGNGGPLRAGVSAFGVGGTNAHIIVEEPPVLGNSEPGRQHQLILWSAKTQPSLNAVANSLSKHFESNPGTNLADAAYTLQVGRSAHKLRRAIVVSSVAEAATINALSGSEAIQLIQNDKPFESPRLIFCFPGQGVQAVDMGRQLYEAEAVFRDSFDACDKILTPMLHKSLVEIVYPSGATPEATDRLNQTIYTQPAIFAVEYALAQLWISWGITPAAMVGHSVGEYVAATLAGVLSLEDALTLIAARSRLMQGIAHGSMLAVRAGEEAVAKLIAKSCAELDIAAINSPKLTVVSGTDAAMNTFIAQLDAEKIVSRRLTTSHAFHSRMLDPMLDAFASHVANATINAPTIPYVSSLTGKWVTAGEIQQPSYWTKHLRQTVRFAEAIATAADAPETILLEVGPSETLVQMIRQTTGVGAGSAPVFASQAAAKDLIPESKSFLAALGKLWAAGIEPDWQKFHQYARRKRILLPTYAFDRKRHWIEPSQARVEPLLPTSAVSTPVIAVPSPSSHTLLSSGPSLGETPIFSEEAIPMPASSTADDAMLNDLKALITDLSGTDLADAESEASFLELGFDSLFLTQLTQGIQSKYKVKLTFRQIMESYPTLDSLAAHLEATVAPGLQPSRIAAPAAIAHQQHRQPLRSAATSAPRAASVAPVALCRTGLRSGAAPASMFVQSANAAPGTRSKPFSPPRCRR